jgi:hypothetical protein
MAICSGGFWPEEIKPKIQTPLAILRARANELTDITKGILIGKVSSTIDTDQIYHSLDAVVPALNGFRQRILTISHQVKAVYPAYLDAKVEWSAETLGFPELLQEMREEEGAGKVASTDDELIELLKRMLHSRQVKSTLVSLIAIANEGFEEESE